VKYVVSIARFIYALVFLLMVIDHFSTVPVQRNPVISFSEPFFGMIAIWSSLTIMVGFKARWSAWFIAFYVVYDSVMTAMLRADNDDLQVMLTRNLSLLAAALMITYFGAGPLSIDSENKIRRKRFRRYHKDAHAAPESLLATPR
jgi:putative oxidoreductase